jgi:hypothetical protein
MQSSTSGFPLKINCTLTTALITSYIILIYGACNYVYSQNWINLLHESLMKFINNVNNKMTLKHLDSHMKVSGLKKHTIIFIVKFKF